MNHYLRLGKRWLREKSTVIIIHLQTCCSSPNTSRACNKVYQQEFAKKGGRGWLGQIHIQRGTQTQITELKQRRRRRQRERQKTCITYISLPSLHDYDVKMPNFTFCGECEHKTTLFSFPELQYSLLEFNSRRKLPTFDELKETE